MKKIILLLILTVNCLTLMELNPTVNIIDPTSGTTITVAANSGIVQINEYHSYNTFTKVYSYSSSYSAHVASDNDDLWYGNAAGGYYYTAYNYIRCGEEGGIESFTGFLNFDTGIVSSIDTTSNCFLTINVELTELESGDYLALRNYNIGGNGDSNSCFENSNEWSTGLSHTDTSAFNPLSTGSYNATIDTDFLNTWASNRLNEEKWISFYIYNGQGLPDIFENDRIQFSDRQAGESNSPKLSFDYTLTPVSASYDITTNIGRSVDVSFDYLIIDSIYDIRDTDTNTLLERFQAAGATFSTSVIITRSGINHFTLSDVSTGEIMYRFEIVGTDQFDSLVYEIVPILIAVAVIVFILKMKVIDQ